MEIFIPKFKDYFIFPEGEEPRFNTRVKGEYRAVLRGPGGVIKHDSGWQPNMILDQGLAQLATFGGNCFAQMYLGNSNTAEATGQVGIQGTAYPDNPDSAANVSNNTPSGPNYERISTISRTWDAGSNTSDPDYIREFTWGRPGGTAADNGTIRVVLATPILKAAADSLTIEHRLTWYPETSLLSGTFDLSGTLYDWQARSSNLDIAPTTHPGNLVSSTGTALQTHSAFTGAIGATVEDVPASWAGDMGISSSGVGTSGASKYGIMSLTADVDNCNGTIRSICTPYSGKYFNGPGVQFEIDKNSDGSFLLKENTHEFVFNYRQYVSRYP